MVKTLIHIFVWVQTAMVYQNKKDQIDHIIDDQTDD